MECERDEAPPARQKREGVFGKKRLITAGEDERKSERAIWISALASIFDGPVLSPLRGEAAIQQRATSLFKSPCAHK